MYQLRELSFPQRLPLPEAELKFVLMCQRVCFQPGLHCHFARELLVQAEYFAVQAALELVRAATAPLLVQAEYFAVLAALELVQAAIVPLLVRVVVLQAVPERVH